MKFQVKFTDELNTALTNIQTANVALRLAGAKRLSFYSRRELGWNCLCVREWFLNEKNKAVLTSVVFNEDDERVLDNLLSTMNFFYSRYITHSMWKSLYDYAVDSECKEWLRTIAEKFINHGAFSAVKQAAFILAEIGDSRAWDIFGNLLKKRASISAWVCLACGLYAKNSMTAKQRDALIQTFETIIAKSKNKSVCHKAEQAKIYLSELIFEKERL
ncbi:hypothetical protein ACYULU_12400 [Breznakiellaceae bacterium SP9]